MENWHKLIINKVLPVAKEFCEVHGGTLSVKDREIFIRISCGFFLTVQVFIIGKNSEPKIEVNGIGNSGFETMRTVFTVKSPSYDIDLKEFRKALEATLR